MRIRINNIATSGQRAIRQRITKTQGTATAYSSRPTGEIEHYTFSVVIDETDVEAMAARAAHSKGGKCKDGPLTVKITSRRRTGSKIDYSENSEGWKAA